MHNSIDDRYDGRPDPADVPAVVRCSCGVILDAPGGPAPALVLDGACDGRVAAVRLAEAEAARQQQPPAPFDPSGPEPY